MPLSYVRRMDKGSTTVVCPREIYDDFSHLLKHSASSQLWESIARAHVDGGGPIWPGN